MSLVAPLVGFGLRQVIGDFADNAVQIVDAVEQRFRDHSRTLPKALENAHNRAWQALGVALAGGGLLDRVKVFFASGDDKGVREQVQVFLHGNAVSFDGAPADFRRECLDELKRLRKSGSLAVQGGAAAEIARQAAVFRRHAEPQGLIEESRRAVAGVADALAEGYPNLARLLRTPTPAGPPLLAAAFCYFFRREVETDDELAHGLFFDGLRQLSASQAKAFGEVGKALTALGGQFDAVFEQMGRIEAAVAETHGAVLDVQAELQRQRALHIATTGEVRTLLEQVLSQRGRVSMEPVKVRPTVGPQTRQQSPTPRVEDTVLRETARLSSLGKDGRDYLKTVAPNRIDAWRASAAAGSAESQHLLALCLLFGAGTDANPTQAVMWLRKAAGQGYARAQHSLGGCYSKGEGVEKDDAKALHWVRKAAEQDLCAARCLLGAMYLGGRGVSKDTQAAVRVFCDLAETGHAISQYFLGTLLAGGQGIPKDEAAAMEWYRKAAEQGCAKAQTALALMYTVDEGIIADEAETVRWFQQAAEQGDARAQFNLALMLASGRGTQKDESRAVKWYYKAAEQGHIDAQLNLGAMYEHGRGVRKDEATAVQWYRNAAEQKNPAAQFNLGLAHEYGRGAPKDEAAAADWYRKAAEQGCANAQFNLGVMYANGRGVPEDEATAVQLYSKAAERGYALAQCNLVWMYENGWGVAKDEAAAIHWYRKSAQQGDAAAQFNLGTMYAGGRGVSRDDAQAMHWYRKAADQGDADAQNNLGRGYAEGRGVVPDDAEAVRWFWKATEQGNDWGQNNLGRMYAEGRGVPKDDDQAVQWFRKAAEQGLADAQYNLGRMYADDRGVAKDEVVAVQWLRKAAEQGHAEAKANLLKMDPKSDKFSQAVDNPVLQDLKAREQGSESKDWLRQAKEQESGQQERASLHTKGEAMLADLVRRSLDRTAGKPTLADNAAAGELCRQHHIKRKRAEAIVREVRRSWEETFRRQG